MYANNYACRAKAISKLLDEKMKMVDKKQLRIIRYALKHLFSDKAFFVFDEPKDYFKIDNLLLRELRLGDGRAMFLSGVGLQHLDSIVVAFDQSDLFGSQADYSDVAHAVRTVFAQLMADRRVPPDVGEFVEMVRNSVESQIDTHTFAVPIYGINLEGSDSLTLGSFAVTLSPVDYIQQRGINHSGNDLTDAVQVMGACCWLIGSARGTANVGLEKFRTQAELVVGALALFAASMYERGASGFRIGVVMSPEQANGRNVWMSWTERKLQLGVSVKFVSTQDFLINSATLQRLREDNGFDRLFTILELAEKTPLEVAITRAVYWFADAHRDSAPAMRLVKYWSCIETFFSTDKEDITHSVSSGLATVLTMGGYAFVEQAEYAALRRRITRLYGLRSRAVHRGSFDHVSKTDVAVLGQWVSWMLINMVSFVERGYTNPKEIKAVSDQLDLQLMGTRSLRNGKLTDNPARFRLYTEEQ
jgi:hypothetical protein